MQKIELMTFDEYFADETTTRDGDTVTCSYPEFSNDIVFGADIATEDGDQMEWTCSYMTATEKVYLQWFFYNRYLEEAALTQMAEEPLKQCGFDLMGGEVLWSHKAQMKAWQDKYEDGQPRLSAKRTEPTKSVLLPTVEEFIGDEIISEKTQAYDYVLHIMSQTIEQMDEVGFDHDWLLVQDLGTIEVW
jgi:hypothetical protein